MDHSVMDQVPPLLTYLLGLFSVVGGIVLKMLWDADANLRSDLKSLTSSVEALAKMLRDHEVKDAESYVTRQELKDAIKGIDDRLNNFENKVEEGFKRIYDKLDSKQDKPAAAHKK